MKVTRFEAASLRCIEVAPANADGRDLPLVICMHGLGDRGDSYVDLAMALSTTDYRFVLPTAPLSYQGFGYAWFPLEFGSANMGPGVAKAGTQVHQLLDELRQRYQTSAARTILGGFSQGGMMTLQVGLRYPEKLGGLLALSTLLVADATFNWLNPPASVNAYYSQDTKLQAVLAEAARHKTPVFMAHGVYDPVVPVVAGRATRDLLQKAGLFVEYYEFRGAHEITMDELGKIKAFLSRAL